jgi:hypothetical protein
MKPSKQVIVGSQGGWAAKSDAAAKKVSVAPIKLPEALPCERLGALDCKWPACPLSCEGRAIIGDSKKDDGA